MGSCASRFFRPGAGQTRRLRV